MFYCEGRACQRRNQCIFHNIDKHPDVVKTDVIQYIDQSLNGSGGVDANGKCWSTWNCGDNGDYVLFEPVPEDVHKKQLAEKLSEWDSSLYHRDGSEKSIYEILLAILDEVDRRLGTK